jgi:hypothetical protein
MKCGKFIGSSRKNPIQATRNYPVGLMVTLGTRGATAVVAGPAGPRWHRVG